MHPTWYDTQIKLTAWIGKDCASKRVRSTVKLAWSISIPTNLPSSSKSKTIFGAISWESTLLLSDKLI